MSRVGGSLILVLLVALIGVPALIFNLGLSPPSDSSSLLLPDPMPGRGRLRPISEVRLPDALEPAAARDLLRRQQVVLDELRRRDFTGALLKLRANIVQHPGAISLYYELLLLELRYGELSAAQSLLQIVRRTAPDDERTKLMVRAFAELQQTTNREEQEELISRASRELYSTPRHELSSLFDSAS